MVCFFFFLSVRIKGDTKGFITLMHLTQPIELDLFGNHGLERVNSISSINNVFTKSTVVLYLSMIWGSKS